MKLNPQLIKKQGKSEFVVLPIEEFEAMTELIEDYEDLNDDYSRAGAYFVTICTAGLFNSIKTCIFKAYAVIDTEKIRPVRLD